MRPKAAVALAGLLACLCGCPDGAGRQPAPASPAPVVLSPASLRALAALRAPVEVTADLRDLPLEDQRRAAGLLDAFAAAGPVRWRRGPLDAPAVALAAGQRRELLPLARLPRLDLVETEAGLTTRLLRLAHGRKKIGVTVGLGEEGWAGLSDPEVGLADAYDVTQVAWAAPDLAALDALVVDGPRGPVPPDGRAAVERFLATGRPVLFLVAPDGDPALLAATFVRARPGLVVDPVNGTPVQSGERLVTAYAPLAQVLAAGPGEPLAHLAYVGLPLAVELEANAGPGGARALLRTSTHAYRLPPGGGAVSAEKVPPPAEGEVPGPRVLGFAHELPAPAPGGPAVRVAVLGSAALVGKDRLALYQRLHAEVAAGGFRAVHRLVDWLVADVELAPGTR